MTEEEGGLVDVHAQILSNMLGVPAWTIHVEREDGSTFQITTVEDPANRLWPHVKVKEIIKYEPQ